MSSRDRKTGAMERGIEGDTVLPASPNECAAKRGRGCGRRVGAGILGRWPFVDVGGPGVGHAAAVGEVHDRDAQLLLHDQRNAARSYLPDWRVEGHAPARPARAASVGNRSRQSPISANRLAALTMPDLGRLEKMC